MSVMQGHLVEHKFVKTVRHKFIQFICGKASMTGRVGRVNLWHQLFHQKHTSHDQ